MRHKRVLRAAPIAAPVLLIAMSMTAQAQGATGHAVATSRVSSVPGGQQPMTRALASTLSRDVTDKVIIVLKNQLARLPDTPANSARRRAAVAAIQHGVLSELAATHARNVKSISLVNAVAATVSPGEAKRLARNRAVAKVTPDRPIPIVSSLPLAKSVSARAGLPPLPGACPTARNGVQLNPEAVLNIHAASQSGKNTAQGLGYTGAGVKVAWIADGLDPNNPDFIRASGKHVFVDYQDFSGTGTSAPTSGGEAFLDASSIAAQGRHVYNVQNYGVGLTVPCRIRILGVAPGSSLVGLNVFGSSNVAFNSVFLEAINYAVSVDHVNVINESFGSNVFPDIGSLDLTKQANDAAIKAGVTVVVSSGDAGPTNTLGSPATDRHVISAGATTTYRAYAQTGIGGIGVPGVNGWIDNNISGLSSGGFAQDGSTVDVVAPGDLNWTLCTPKPAFAACTDFSNRPSAVNLEGGTSEAAPLTAGVAALVIQAYKASHHGHLPTPAAVKRIIVSTAQDISAPAEQQGAGLVDAYQAVLAARSFPGATLSKQGHAVLASPTQLNTVAAASAAKVLNESLANDGSSTVTVHLSSRTLSAPTTVDAESLKLTAAQSFAAEVTFGVPAGQARLSASVALPDAGVDLSLIAPNGHLAEFNLPQGPGNYGNAQVANPAPGTWTALIEGLPNANPSSINASFLATTSRWKRFGTLSTNTLTLPPGVSANFTLTVATPSLPGDQSGSIVVRNPASQPGFAAVTTIPVTVRALVPTPSPTTTFEGTLTGGNGRGANTGQSDFYEVNVAPGTKALNASVSTAHSSNTVFAELVDPSGEAVSVAQNGMLATNASGNSELVPETGAQLHVLSPVPGRWTLIIDFYNAVSGTAATQPFTVTMDVANPATAASESGLPNSPLDKFTSGVPEPASVTVTNNGTVPEEYFLDARSTHQVTLKLAAQTTSAIELPNLFGIVPTYLVPTLTTNLSAKVTAKAVNFFDLSYPFGDPDLISSTGKTSTLSFGPVSGDIPNGDWTITPFLKGPDGANGAKPVNANVAMTATTSQIDPAVSDPTGDLWSGATNPNAGLTPVVVEPGQSATIPLTITGHGSVGQVFSGQIFIDDVSFNPGQVTYNGLFGAFPTASTVARFPYTYSIGS